MRRIRVHGVIAKEELEQQREAEAAAAAAATEISSTAEEDEDELDEHAESAETELLEAGDVEDEAEAEADDVDSAVEATEALESIRLVLEARQDKGLSPAEAELANIALKGAYKLAGFTTVKMYSPESFTEQKRVKITRLSMEEIDVNLKEVWEKAKEAILRFWEQVKEWVVKVFTALGRYKERAATIAAAAAKLEGTPKAAELDKPALAKALHIGGAVDIGRAISVLEGATKAVIADQKGVIEIAKAAASESADAADKSVTAALAKIGKAVGNPKAEGFDKQFVSRSDELPGGFAIIAAWNTMADVKVGLSAYKPSAAEVQLKGVKVLTKEEIVKVAEAVAKLVDELKELDGALKAADAEAKTLTGAIDSLYKAGESNPQDKEKIKILTRLAQTVLSEPGRSYAGYATRTIKALLDVAELSVREYAEGAKNAATSALPAPDGKEPPAPAKEPVPA
jgi:hypothetical protein